MRLNVGRVYAVRSEHGCTVTFADGSPCATIPAGGGTFVAQAGEMLVSDELAEVRELPNGEEVLHGQMLAEQPETGMNVMKYAHCVTVDDIQAVNADFINDVPSTGEWVYPLPNLEDAYKLFAADHMVSTEYKLKYLRAVWPKVKSIDHFSTKEGATGLIEIDLEAPVCTNVFAALNAHSLKKARLIIPKVTSISKICWYTKNLSELELYCPNVTYADSAFTGTILDKKSTLQILNHLKAFDDGKSHSCLIGIHVDHKADDEVLAAIAEAEAKGWTLTVQWNGTPTASASVTYGLRKPPIYARVGDMELPDGTTERYLDWGHYVTDPSGYEEFRSVDAAEEHFNIKPTE